MQLRIGLSETVCRENSKGPKKNRVLMDPNREKRKRQRRFPHTTMEQVIRKVRRDTFL